MMIRIIGALLIVVGCGGFGFLLAASYKYEVSTLKSFIASLDTMESELRYRKTPLPLLCQYIAANQTGSVKQFYLNLAKELQQQIQPDAATCAVLALNKTNSIPQQSREMILQLGKSLGKYDIDGQILGIQAVRNESMLRLNQLCKNQEQRLKSYRTLGVCAGAAIAILVI